ncbi:TetR family transcriptional regulator [Nocardia mexicana]|uniref:TetR family transcriptional regulator n=1 Tax=Nocardia mexicana TaxID=279262 RepID=A0A370HAC1_9NOCA|nr:TetR family transcriptional regulator [Nocardia mexicana]
MDIAHEFVSAHGLDALTMRRLATAAEVTSGALYKHVRDRRDLQRAMADAIFGAVDIADVDLGNPTADQVVHCCERMRHAMLGFRDGGRIVAGSYSPSAATLRVSGTLLSLLEAVTLPQYDAGEIALVLRSYTTGFVIEEQAYLELVQADEWEPLVRSISSNGHGRTDKTSDLIALMTSDRGKRFTSGLASILTGPVLPAT